MVPGIKNFVIEHLNGLGFPVEDDGEPQPIFIIGITIRFEQCFAIQNTSRLHQARVLSGGRKLPDKLADAREKSSMR